MGNRNRRQESKIPPARDELWSIATNLQRYLKCCSCQTYIRRSSYEILWQVPEFLFAAPEILFAYIPWWFYLTWLNWFWFSFRCGCSTDLWIKRPGASGPNESGAMMTNHVSWVGDPAPSLMWQWLGGWISQHVIVRSCHQFVFLSEDIHMFDGIWCMAKAPKVLKISEVVRRPSFSCWRGKRGDLQKTSSKHPRKHPAGFGWVNWSNLASKRDVGSRGCLKMCCLNSFFFLDPTSKLQGKKEVWSLSSFPWASLFKDFILWYF